VQLREPFMVLAKSLDVVTLDSGNRIETSPYLIPTSHVFILNLSCHYGSTILFSYNLCKIGRIKLHSYSLDLAVFEII